MAPESDAQTGEKNPNPYERLKGRNKIRTDVVIVEDKEEDRQVLRTVMESCGYKVVEVRDARKFTQIIGGQKSSWIPELIITDLVLDGSSGYEVLRNVRPRFEEKKVPLIVVSSLSGDEDIFEAQTAGANAFLVKPYSPQDLLDAICSTLENLRKPIMERKNGLYVKRPEEEGGY
ncbi:MAG: response regulator [Bdellovibrionales bacterium]|nr:response regulator [Bdellovibrionales bacterium]